MKIINIIENGLLISYDDYESLSEKNKENFIDDDFCDCDYLKFKGETIVDFIKKDDNIFYIIKNSNFEIYENEIKEILKLFFMDEFKKHFLELHTYNISKKKRQEYKKEIHNNITLFYRGGVGYYYGVYKLINKDLKNKFEGFKNGNKK